MLEGKQRTEEEFVHTFNALHGAGKQIVLSSDRPPEALSRLAERLRDRFAGGFGSSSSRPDLRTRIALLWRLASDRAGELPEPAVLQEIAARVPEQRPPARGRDDPRPRGRLAALRAALRAGRPPGARPRPRAIEPRARGAASPTLVAIQDAVCAVCGLSREELLSPRRSTRVAHARQLAMYLARELTPMSLAEIARGFDRDHTTVLHAVRAVDGRLEPGSETAQRNPHRAARPGDA